MSDAAKKLNFWVTNANNEADYEYCQIRARMWAIVIIEGLYY